MLSTLLGMALVMLLVIGVTGFGEKRSEDWEKRYFHEFGQGDGPVSRNNLFEKPGHYREVHYLLSFIN